ncbi:MAG TPA: serine hydrolase domain-containing protein [Burkholderiales bacterium]|jgi:CubicO group peptidase (beta-lactamase class C family)|nr:serine hydrolase domain-containing protein [Burkholderiales bacterium]
MKIRTLLPALLLSLFAMPALAAPVDPLPRAKPESVGFSSARLAHIDEVLRADIEAGRMPGAVVAIARKGKLVYFKAFGYRDKAANVPMTTDTIFAIASMTKPMVTVGALQLYEQGRVLIDDPVSKFLPQFANMKVARMDAGGKEIIDTVPAARRITIQDIMRHTSGIIYGGRGSTAVHKLYPDSSSSAALEYTGPEFIDKLGSLPLMYQPGTVWDYGFSIDVLGQVVESITKERLGQYLQQSLFQPLGMKDTGFLVPANQAARYARPLPNDPDTGKPQSVLDLTKPTKFDCGGGCAVSTASDYLRFAQMLLNHGQLGGKQILSRKTVDFMTSNQLGPEVKNLIGAADPTRADYGFGLGMAVRTTPGIVRMMGSVGDFSWPGASGTNWWADPKEELAVVFMAQTPGPMRWHYRQKINALVYQALN